MATFDFTIPSLILRQMLYLHEKQNILLIIPNL